MKAEVNGERYDSYFNGSFTEAQMFGFSRALEAGRALTFLVEAYYVDMGWGMNQYDVCVSVERTGDLPEAFELWRGDNAVSIPVSSLTGSFVYTPTQSGVYVFEAFSAHKSTAYVGDAAYTGKEDPADRNFYFTQTLQAGQAFRFSAAVELSSAAAGDVDLTVRLTRIMGVERPAVALSPGDNELTLDWNEGDIQPLTFTPTESGLYAFVSDRHDCDPVAYVNGETYENSGFTVDPEGEKR